VEAQIARLHEELSLTTAFVLAMHRGGDDRAAVGAIDEQRIRLAAGRRAMLKEMARPRNHRIHAALAGLAAAVLVGSASFAGYRALAPAAPNSVRAIHTASVALQEAQAAQDPSTVAQLIGDAHRSLLSLSASALVDTQNRATVGRLLEQELQIIQSKASGSATLVSQVASVAAQLNVELPKIQPSVPAVSPPQPATTQQPSPASSSDAAPSAGTP
jgi:hypothetical protein